MSWLDKLLGKGKGYKQLDEATEFEEFDKSAVALNAAIEAAEVTAQKSGNIFDQIAYVELLLQRTPGNKSYNQNLKELKATAAVLAAEEDYKSGSEGSVVGSEGSAGAFPDDGGKKSRYSRKSKSKYSRKSKSKYSRKSKSKSKYSRKSKSKYSRKSKSKYSRKY
jgi:hypothetical protein